MPQIVGAKTWAFLCNNRSGEMFILYLHDEHNLSSYDFRWYWVMFQATFQLL